MGLRILPTSGTNGSGIERKAVSRMDLFVLKNEFEAASIPCRIGEAMKDHTSFCIGGPADGYVLPDTAEKLALCLSICARLGVPWILLGNGSNTVFADGGFRGVVIGTSALTAPLRWSTIPMCVALPA